MDTQDTVDTKILISRASALCQKVIQVPGDKSLSHRALILGAIANGQTKIHGFLHAKDCLATLEALRKMGVNILDKGAYLEIKGVGLYGLRAPNAAIDCQNSGTAMRLLSGLLVGQPFKTELIGDESLSRRPMGRVIEPLNLMGADIKGTEDKAPLFINHHQPSDRVLPKLNGIEYELPVASAQLKSCLLLAGLYVEEEVVILERDLSRDHTERMLQLFGYPHLQWSYPDDGKVIHIKGKGSLVGSTVYIPGDLSSAAFFIVAATLIDGAQLYIENVGINPTRTGMLDLLVHMGAHIRLSRYREISNEPVSDLFVKSAPLHAITINDLQVPRMIDEFPILFVAAAMAEGETVLFGLLELRHKETDRIRVMMDALHILGVDMYVDDDCVHIFGSSSRRFKGGVVDACGDHRIAMALAIAGCLCSSPLTILNAHNIETSFPNFCEMAQLLGLDIQFKENQHA